MRLRLPLLCAALIGLAACGSGNNDPAATTPTPTPAATAPTPATTAPATPAPASTAAPATSGSAAAPGAAAPVADADDSRRPAPKPFVDEGKWVEGKNYFRIDPAQPTSSPGKIEVTEVFSYGCPFCYQFNGLVEQMAKDLPRGRSLAIFSTRPLNW